MSDINIHPIPQAPAPYNPAAEGQVTVDWDICPACQRAYKLVGQQRVLRKHGPRRRRCVGSGRWGIYRTAAEKAMGEEGDHAE